MAVFTDREIYFARSAQDGLKSGGDSDFTSPNQAEVVLAIEVEIRWSPRT